MAERVTYKNIFSESRNNIYSLINDRSNVADPLNSSSEYRKFVYSRLPDIKAIDFAGFPFLVVNGSNTETVPEGATVNMKSKFVNFTIEIEVYSSDRGYGGKEGNGLTYMDSISNDIFKTLNNKKNRITLQKNGLYFSNITSTNVIVQDIHSERIYYRSFILSLKAKMQVSA